MSTTIELSPVDSRKSFYGKCKVFTGGQSDNANMLYLQSYSTIVAEYDKATDTITIHGYYSPTTARHIRAFCKHVGKQQPTKEQMLDCVSY